jgi:hypothetical protein
VRASGEAQALAYSSKQFGLDPYELWHIGESEVPPHPRPRVYRSLLYAMAYWLEDQDMGKTKLLAEAQGAKVEITLLLDQLTTVSGQ